MACRSPLLDGRDVLCGFCTGTSRPLRGSRRFAARSSARRDPAVALRTRNGRFGDTPRGGCTRTPTFRFQEPERRNGCHRPGQRRVQVPRGRVAEGRHRPRSRRCGRADIRPREPSGTDRRKCFRLCIGIGSQARCAADVHGQSIACGESLGALPACDGGVAAQTEGSGVPRTGIRSEGYGTYPLRQCRRAAVAVVGGADSRFRGVPHGAGNDSAGR